MSAYHFEGLYIDLRESTYRQDPAISNSKLQLIKKSPAHFLHYAQKSIKETQAMIFGRALHMALLEPERFESEVLGVDAGRASKSFKELINVNKSNLVMTLDELQTINDMVFKINQNSTAQSLLSNHYNLREASIFFSRDDIRCKGRMDLFNRNDKFICDIKTTSDASPRGFMDSIKSYGYHQQAAFYIDGLKALGEEVDDFYFIAIEKTEPYAIGVYALDQDWVKAGRKENQRLINIYKDCVEKRQWHSYTNQIEILECPKYLIEGSSEFTLGEERF